jgi:hypothetical protein
MLGVEATVDINKLGESIAAGIQKASGSFTFVLENATESEITLSCCPKKNSVQMRHPKLGAKKFEFQGKSVKQSDNIQHIKAKERGYIVFNTTGVVLAEVCQLILVSGEVALSKSGLEDFKEGFLESGASEEDLYWYAPRYDEGIVPCCFLVHLYNETRRDKRTASVIEDVVTIEQFEEGTFTVEPEVVHQVHQPTRTKLPVLFYKVSTQFKDSDNAVLYMKVIKEPDPGMINLAVKNLFNEIDSDSSGEITRDEFVDYCKGKNPKADETKIKAMFTRLDKDKSGSVTFDEFAAKQDELMKFISMIELKFEKKHNKLSETKKKTGETFAELGTGVQKGGSQVLGTVAAVANLGSKILSNEEK